MLSTALTTVANYAKEFYSQLPNNKPITNSKSVFAMGDAIPVLDQKTAYLGALLQTNGSYYNTPVDFSALARLMDANSYHGQALQYKADRIVQFASTTSLLSMNDLRRAALDYVLTGNCYFQKFYNSLGQITRLAHLPAVYMRRGAVFDFNTDPFGSPTNVYMRLKQTGLGLGWITFEPDEVLHLKNYDPLQGVYGKPTYLGGIQDVLLSEDATLFRRKYFINGMHLGYILVTTDANFDDDTAKKIEEAIAQGKGAGNFKSIFLNIPRSSSRDPVKVLPIGNTNLNDEFKTIKEATEMQIVAMHGIHPILMCIIPANTGGLGNPIQALQLFYETGIIPLQDKFLELNTVVNRPVIAFNDPVWRLNAT